MKRKIVAIDFDGTCVTHAYPEIGRDIGAAPVLKQLVEDGWSIILWTMRSGETLQAAVEWFEKNEIKLWGINCNPEQHTWTQSPKAYANLYIDDAALGAPLIHSLGKRPFVDWDKVGKQLREKAC